MTGQVSARDEGGVRILTISNPPRGYMNAATASELVDQIAQARSDDTVRVLLFTGGEPGVFIRHYDVGEIINIAEAAKAGAIPENGKREDSPVYAMLDLLLAFPKPTVCAINGVCMGGGFEFALACDIRIAQSGDYPIGLPEARIGILPGLGGMQLLARCVGPQRAKEMVMRGRVAQPEEAVAVGMVDFLADDALEKALEISADLATLSPVALSAIKRMAAIMDDGETIAEGSRTAATEFMRTLVENDEAIDRMRHFMESGENILAQ